MNDLRGYLMDKYGWDLNTVDKQDRSAILEILNHINKETTEKSTPQEEVMNLADFVTSGKSHELGIN